MKRETGLVALAVLVVGLASIGAGPVNGDAAVYAAQVEQGLITERWTHAAYILFFMMFRPLGDVGWWMDVGSALACAGSVALLATRLSGAEGQGRAALVLGALVLPWAAFGEVDPLWLVALSIGCVADPRIAGAGLAVAVSISPAALAGVPWIVMKYQDSRWVGPVVAVALLTVLSGGAWWSGNRGVVTGGWSPDPWSQVIWVLILLGMAWRSLRVRDAAVLFAVLAPGDVPGHWILVLPLLAGVAQNHDRRWWAAMAVLVGVSANHLGDTRARVVRETAVIERIATELQADDHVVGPWSWGVRIGIRATGDPYGVPFSPTPVDCRGARRVHVPLGTWETCR